MLNFGRNSKMKKTEKEFSEIGVDARLYTFNLPAIDACPGAGACKNFCYATQGRYVFNNVSKPRKQNFEILKSMTQDVVSMVNLLSQSIVESFTEKRLLKHNARNIVRIHDSGDFFHKNYFLAWCETLRSLEKKYNIEGYAYTKSLPIVQRFYSEKPENLKIIQSIGGLFDSDIDTTKPHSKVFDSIESMIHAGYIDGNKTDIPAIEGETRIGLVYHGTKKIDKVRKFIV
jgi:hypothetical protein